MITKDDVKYIAALARIHLQEDEVKRFTTNLEDIIHYINKLEKLDVGSVEPTSHVLSLENVYRKDEVNKPLGQEKALSTAISKKDGSFKVPQIIE